MTWKSYKRTYIQRHHPIVCAACGRYDRLDLHHVKPVAEFPELQFEDSNIVPLCRLHHFIIGHLSNWAIYNPNFWDDLNKIKISFTHKTLTRG